MDGDECSGFYFYSNFDSGNLHRVELVSAAENTVPCPTFTGRNEVPSFEFNLWTKPDCAGTEYENANRTWFYFGVRSNYPSVIVKFNMVDLNKQAKLYSQGMGPVYRILPGKAHWDRICDKPTFTNETVFTLSFKCKMPENVNSTLYLAFTYPYTYTELQHKLDMIDQRFKNEAVSSKDDIYFVREKLCDSLEGRRTDLITITSYYNITAERETRLKNLFPDVNVPRPYKFKDKKIIFVSSRVHPGETPASYVFNGFLNLLLTRDDLVAITLRRNYVFKMIPCLNPDGVFNGHYRTDTRGVNLNRMYLNPKFDLHPTIYAARALIRYYHLGVEREDTDLEDDGVLSTNVSGLTLEDGMKNLCWKCKHAKGEINEAPKKVGSAVCAICGEKIQDENNPQGDGASNFESGLFLYMDMHGHASKKGIFMYGNHFDDLESSIKCMLLPKVMSLNNHNFHFHACNFTERNMYLKDKRDGMSKEGSGRVAVYKLTGLIQSYTLECNYNTGRLVNVLPPTIKDPGGKANTHLLVPPKYTPQVFEEVGKAFGVSILDLSSQNPYTRLPNSEYHSLSGLKEWLRVHCASEIGDSRNTSPPQHGKLSKMVHNNTNQVKSRSAIGKSRSLSKPVPRKLAGVKRTTNSGKKEKTMRHPSPAAGVGGGEQFSTAPADDTHLNQSVQVQPSCSYIGEAGSSSEKPRLRPSKSTKSITSRSRMIVNNRPNSCTTSSGVNHIVKNIQNTGLLVKNKLKQQNDTNTPPDDKIKLTEICFIKDTEGKKVIAKYQNESKPNEDDLVVSWNAANTNPQVFTHKAFASQPSGVSAKRPAHSHNFQKANATFNKVSKTAKIKRSKRNIFKRHAVVEGSRKMRAKKTKIIKRTSTD